MANHTVYIYDMKKYTNYEEFIDVLICKGEVQDFDEWLDDNYSSNEVYNIICNHLEHRHEIDKEEFQSIFEDEYQQYIDEEISSLADHEKIIIIF